MNLAAIGKIIAMATADGMAVRFTILAVLGEAEEAVLAGITVSVAGAVLGVHVREKAAENVKRAFEAKRIRREVKFAQQR